MSRPAETRSRRTSSAPTPHIDVEDLSNPLTLAEDHSPVDRTDAAIKTTAIATAAEVQQQQQQRQHHLRPRRGVKWRKEWNKDHDPFRDGRVLIVDLLSRDQTADKRRRTFAAELSSRKELVNFYGSEANAKQPCLRIIHVQNSLWARDFLFEKYGIADPTNPQRDGNAFAKWAQFSKPQRRNNRPVLNARAFRVDKSPLRNVWRIGFGADYLRYFAPSHMSQYAGNSKEFGTDVDDYKLLSVNRWMTEGDSSYSAIGYDCYVQRVSVYIQRNMEGAGLQNEDWNYVAASTYAPRDSEELERLESDEKRTGHNAQDLKMQKQQKEHKEHANLRSDFENGTTIIVFESSHSGLVSDTLIQARAEIEKKWRSLFTDLPRDDFATDSLLALECIDVALKYIMAGIVGSWDKLLSKLEEHVDILEEKIYENPADESRAPELWTNQNLWLKVEKLLSVQGEAFTSLRQHLRELSTDEREFLKEAPDQFSRVQKLIEEDLTKPTANLSDLMYKSVEIRDSRQSLRLGLSMWRLSWITFIFLPLTFISGFFGMNVAVFQPKDGPFPSLKWYFVAAVPLMLIVVVTYLLIKNKLSFRKIDPGTRGTFENIYEAFAEKHPHLWSRNGPRDYVRAKGFFSRIKWALVNRWFRPTRTITARSVADAQSLGFWAQIKHRLARKWLTEIDIEPEDAIDVEMGRPTQEFGAIAVLLGSSTPVAMAEGNPQAAYEMANSPKRRRQMARLRADSHGSSSSDTRNGGPSSSVLRSPSPAPSESMMLEEEETAGDDYEDWDRARQEVEERAERTRSRKEQVISQDNSLLAIPPSGRYPKDDA